jgi:ketosteroid isomerase-like protein
MMWKRTVERAFVGRDVEAMLVNWRDDGVLEFGGTHAMAGRFVGKGAIREWLGRWFGAVDDLDFRVGRVALGNPWAIGLTNTVMFEATVRETSHEGTKVEVEVLIVADLQRGKIARERVYLFDETPELTMWGRRPDQQATDAA